MLALNRFRCEPIAFAAGWPWGLREGQLRREDGYFFSIVGLRALGNPAGFPVLEQPIISQPTKAINGFLVWWGTAGLEILFQARVEPGNVGGMQLAPTVQSTQANYEQRHGGRPTAFIAPFLQPGARRVLYRGLQSEEGSRYHGKYNLNLIIEATPADIEAARCDVFTVGAETLRQLVALDHVINTDARALLFFLDWTLLCADHKPFASHDDPIHRALARSFAHLDADRGTSPLDAVRCLMHARATLALRTRPIALDELGNWRLTETTLCETVDELGFRVSLFDVCADQREVGRWTQPLVCSDGDGRIVLFCRIRDGVLEFLCSLDYELGYLEGAQLTASVSVSPGKRPALLKESERVLLDAAERATGDAILVDCRQSEEGGRFYHDVNRYQIILDETLVAGRDGDDALWITLAQLRTLSTISSIVSIELRCILSLLVAWL
ncbi:MAG: NDP-hexose 2,3-dehydratase family protein [Myxococcales bacterium]|nr:NDP-hexose 2,3-dehydratase family protein [Myxococcales bacterium]